MNRSLSLLTLASGLLVGGCAVGPRYRPEDPVPANTRIGADGIVDSSRRFFDSLATARLADSGAMAATTSTSRSLGADSISDLAWLDLFRDSTLVRLVTLAVNQNRDIRTAVARIREYRANVGIARAPLFPSLYANGSASTNQVAFGAFPPAKFDAIRVTGDVAWELDFWGRIRRGVQAANADLGSQEAAQRAAVLSLISDVASGYLQLLELDQERAIAERTLSSRKQTLALAQSRFNAGVISELDVRQFEAEVAVPAATLAQT
ncbi:MAG: TolC family protein, partial [Gemmatimonadota bacterium]